MYQRLANSILRLSDNANIPLSEDNRDYIEFLAWKALGNEPLPYIPPAAPTQEELFEQLRQERNRRLASSDWTQLVDAPFDANGKLAWREYRQALRDLPSVTSDPSFPVWPEMPGDE